jgi:translation initiation factor eIF-2B subunit alpha/methylthioribose-1-phosphate isomerase
MLGEETMKINGKEKQSLWFENNILYFIDQRKLPEEINIFSASTVEQVCYAITDMVVRGAPAIGAAAAYGMAIGKNDMSRTAELLKKTRPTAFDLFYAVDHMLYCKKNGDDINDAAHHYVKDIIQRCKQIGEHGECIIKDDIRVLTHCNAGALATVDYGTALAPLRAAHRNGKKIFVFADETRPRLQGLLTSWELSQEGIPHAVIADNAAGFYMKNNEIDIVITGADRIAKNGDVANKIGTYEKAVLAKENNIPFYVAAPISTFDPLLKTGDDIIIEQRSEDELKYYKHAQIMTKQTPVKNPAFDVTPVKYVTGFITEEGIRKA